MRLIRGITLALVVLPVLSFPIYAKADSVVYGLTESQNPTIFGAGTGVGQAVFADQTMTIDSFGFDVSQKGGGNLEYFIYDATTSSLLLGPTAVSVLNAPKQFTYLDGLSLTLDANNLYYFGVYGTGLMDINMDPTAFSGDGLSLPTSAATSVNVTGDVLGSSLDGTINGQGLSTEDASLRVFSNNPPAVTPEPSSLILMGTGILAAAGALRRRLMS
jgi:PEP-CTERM motif